MATKTLLWVCLEDMAEKYKVETNETRKVLQKRSDRNIKNRHVQHQLSHYVLTPLDGTSNTGTPRTRN